MTLVAVRTVIIHLNGDYMTENLLVGVGLGAIHRPVGRLSLTLGDVAVVAPP